MARTAGGPLHIRQITQVCPGGQKMHNGAILYPHGCHACEHICLSRSTIPLLIVQTTLEWSLNPLVLNKYNRR